MIKGLVILSAFVAVAFCAGLPAECGHFVAPQIPSIPPTTLGDYELQQVSIVLRHGDRIMYQDVPCWPDDSGTYDCQDRHLSTPSYSEDQVYTNTGRIYRKNYMQNRNYYSGTCKTGQLTDKGYQQEFNTGAMYKATYVDSGFLPSEFNTTFAYLRSDEGDRCMQSLEVLLSGFFPSTATTPFLPIFDIDTMDSYYDDITPNDNICPILDTWYDEMQTSQQWTDNYNNELAPLLIDLSTALGYNVDLSAFYQVHDCLVVHACHQQPIPSGITQSLYDQVMQQYAYLYQLKISYPSIQQQAQAGIGHLIQEMTNFMIDMINGEENAKKLVFFSGHDTTLVPILNALNAWDGIWTPYASQIQFELYRSHSDHTDFAMRIAYNGENVMVPGCDDALCSWDTVFSYFQSIFPLAGGCQ